MRKSMMYKYVALFNLFAAFTVTATMIEAPCPVWFGLLLVVANLYFAIHLYERYRYETQWERLVERIRTYNERMGAFL
jgi:Ca2+/Na+ antiporter